MAPISNKRRRQYKAQSRSSNGCFIKTPLVPVVAQPPPEACGWAARDTSGVLSPFKFFKRATGEHDVQFKVLYCGICHSDLHMAKNEWGMTRYPLVPGHEIVGIVTELGSKVGKKFKVGDRVGVGCMVGSCRQCDQCTNDLENYCPQMMNTYGGYSNLMVADQHFVVRWPDKFPLDKGAPLLCAGITAYSPLRFFGLDKPGLHIGVVDGPGGIGRVAVKFAKAFGMKVTVISEKKEAIEELGSDGFLVCSDTEQMQAAAGTLDGIIIDTVFAVDQLLPLVNLLKPPHGKLILVGAQEKPVESRDFALPVGRTISRSGIGGMKETQEMIDFAAEHNILPDVEVIPIDYVNKAMERLLKSDVKYRFVIDVAKSLKAE